MSIFVYGTLRHRSLLEIVLGRPLDGIDLHDDALSDNSVFRSLDGTYPVLLNAPGARCAGLRLAGLSDQDRARLRFYEAGFDYTLGQERLVSGQVAQVFTPGPSVAASDTLWDLDSWAASSAALDCIAAKEVMSLFGDVPAAQIAARRPRIWARAQSRLNAQSSRHGARTLQGKIDMEHYTRTHFQFFAFDEMRFRHETFSGAMSGPVDRGVFVPTDAAIVLPYDPLTDRVLLVEQIRTGPIARGDRSLWQLEPVAGLIDPGETPEETARREAFEEAGLDLHGLEPVAENYTSPGGSADFQYIYIGLCDLPDVRSRLGGLASEGEDIRSHILGFDELFAMAEGKTIANMPLTLAIYWLAAHRSRLRSAFGKDTSDRQT